MIVDKVKPKYCHTGVCVTWGLLKLEQVKAEKLDKLEDEHHLAMPFRLALGGQSYSSEEDKKSANGNVADMDNSLKSW